MNRLHLVRLTGLLFICLVGLVNIPYLLLIQRFEYDDILRQPVDSVLTKFHAGGTSLILIWFVFGLAALLFIPASILLHMIIARKDMPYLATATVAGTFSGILQSIGLMRWVFVVPVLANLYTTTTDIVTRKAVAITYQAVHQYGGVVIGEHLGQTLLVYWTLGIAMAMRQSSLFKSWISFMGLITVPLLILGQSELLATVIPTVPVLEMTPVGFIVWEVWLLTIGISLLRVSHRRVALTAN